MLSAALLNKPVPGGYLLGQLFQEQSPALGLKRGAAVSLALSQADCLHWGAWEWRGGSCDGLLKCWGAGAGGVKCGSVMVHLLANYLRVCQCEA